MNLEELKRKMDEEHYIYDDTLSTVLYVALQLGRPLLIGGRQPVWARQRWRRSWPPP